MASLDISKTSGVILYINGVPFAQATGCRWYVHYDRKTFYAIDEQTPQEIAPATVKTQGSISCIRMIGDGGAIGAGMSAGVSNFLKEKYFSILLLDRKTQMQLFRADQCSLVSESWEVSPKNIVTGTFAFESIVSSNELA